MWNHDFFFFTSLAYFRPFLKFEDIKKATFLHVRQKAKKLVSLF